LNADTEPAVNVPGYQVDAGITIPVVCCVIISLKLESLDKVI
jgi:hypothetical protein